MTWRAISISPYQEKLHQNCSELADGLTHKLRDMVLKQRQRSDHVRSISADVKEALASSQANTDTVRRCRLNRCNPFSGRLEPSACN
jgi:hypothetical protein